MTAQRRNNTSKLLYDQENTLQKQQDLLFLLAKLNILSFEYGRDS